MTGASPVCPLTRKVRFCGAGGAWGAGFACAEFNGEMARSAAKTNAVVNRIAVVAVIRRRFFIEHLFSNVFSKSAFVELSLPRRSLTKQERPPEKDARWQELQSSDLPKR